MKHAWLGYPLSFAALLLDAYLPTPAPSRKKRIVLCILGAVLALLLGAYLSAPAVARYYVQKHYPGVTVGKVTIQWREQSLIFHDVKVDRPNLKASLPIVYVNRQKNVVVRGGLVEITLGEGAGSEGPNDSLLKSLRAEGLTVKADYHGTHGEATGVKIDPVEVCFDAAEVKHPKGQAKLSVGCVKRDKSEARADRIEVPFTIPFPVPGVESEQTVVLTGAKYDALPAIGSSSEEKRLRFDRATVGGIEVKGPATARLGTFANLQGETIVFDTAAVTLSHSWLGPDPVTFEAVALIAPLAALKGGQGDIQVMLGNAKFRIDLANQAVSGSESCNDWLDAFPKPLPKAMQSLAGNFTGDLNFKIQVKPTPKVEIKSTCRFDCKAEPIKTLLQPTFHYSVYNAKNELVDREAGSRINGWIFLGNLPPHVSQAFLLMEDPDFPRHKGVLPKALENSLKINLEKGQFSKGGSTITMQLAKNLWLSRTKSVTRKAEEALLTYALESCFSKEQILELYLNVIEFGPDLYGLGLASRHYFGKDAALLAPDEAFYLASILPSPRKALPPNQGGLDRARRIMKALANSGIISEYMVDAPPSPGTTEGWDVGE